MRRNARAPRRAQRPMARPMSRRRFLKGAGTAAVAGAAAMAGKGRRVRATPGNVYDVDNATDFLNKVNNANDGDVLILAPGTYNCNNASLKTTKSLTVKAQYPDNKPVITNLWGWVFYSYAHGTEWHFEDVIVEHHGFGIEKDGVYDDFDMPFGHERGEFLVYGGNTPDTRGSFFGTNCVFEGKHPEFGSGFAVYNHFYEDGDEEMVNYVDKVRLENCTCKGPSFGLTLGTVDPDPGEPKAPNQGPHINRSHVDINEVKISDCTCEGTFTGIEFANLRGKNQVTAVNNTCISNDWEGGANLAIARGQYDGALFKGNRCKSPGLFGIFINGIHITPDWDQWPNVPWVTANPSGWVRNCSFIDNDCVWSDGPEWAYHWISDLFISECQHSTFVKNKALTVQFGDCDLDGVPVAFSNDNVYIDFNLGSWINVVDGSENNIINTLGMVKQGEAFPWPSEE
jgi:hypothetical protein